MFGSRLLLLSVLWVLSSAQLFCDPETEYEAGGQCCKKCEPGTKMVDTNCERPSCVPCDKYKYQDDYNTDSSCKNQPVCSPLKNFVVPDTYDIKKKIVCLCKQGFHCLSDVCMTCVQHNTCGLGMGVLHKGNQTHDTVCQSCPEGTFSNEISMDKGCVEHTKCSQGYTAEVAGTNQSDTVCVMNKRVHVIVGTLVAILAVVIAAVCLVLHLRRKQRFKVEKKMDCVECIGANGETTKLKPQEETVMMPQTPVESEDLSPSVCSEEHGRSENGKVVCPVVEDGKATRLPRQESQISSTSTVSYSHLSN